LSYSSFSLPREIIDMLSRRVGASLLVKGEPGSGKTLFALSLCKAFSGFNECFYLTARSTVDEVAEYYPIAKGLLDDRRVIDVTESRAEVKLDAAVSMRMYDKPSFLQGLYSMIKGGRNPPFVVIDSLESLKAGLKLPENDMSLEEVLIDMARETGGKNVFVSERMETSSLEYMVDGVITLQKENRNGRFLRLMKIGKARGVPFARSLYLFTLEDGVFSAVNFEALSMSQKVTRANMKFDLIYRESALDGHVSTGIKKLDNLIGGYLKGSLNLIEVDKGVGECHDYLHLPAVINHVIGGGRVALIPPGGLSAAFMKHILLSVLPEDRVKKNLVIADFGEKTNEGVILLKGDSLLQDAEAIFQYLDEGGLLVAGMDTLQHIYGLDELKNSLGRLIARIKRSKIVTLGIVKYEQEVINLLNHLADTHFMVRNMYGTVVAYGVIPHTPVFHPFLAEGKTLEVKLTVIV